MPENLHLELDEGDKKAKDEGEEKGILNFSYQWGKIMKGADAAFKAVDKAAKESGNTVKKRPQKLAAKPQVQQAAYDADLELQAMPGSTPSLDSDNYEITVPLHELPYSISGHVNPGMNIEHIQVAEVDEDGNLSEWSDVDDFDAASGNFGHELEEQGEYIFSSVDFEGNRSEESETLFLDVEAYMAAPTEGDEEVDETPPSAPVIETNFGDDFAIFEEGFELGGSCDSDTEIMEYQIDDSQWITIENYLAGDTNWSLNETLEIGSHTVNTRAKDLTGNTSEMDSITIFRST